MDKKESEIDNMTGNFILKLKSIGVDTEGTINRFCNNLELYKKILVKFLSDKNYEDLMNSLNNKDYKDAEMYSHTLKGLCSNLGFVELSKISAEILGMLREGKYNNLEDMREKLREEYIKVITLIKEV
ncbi:Hpt domain-containing protein [Clostridium paraputrificum]|uniref:Hpt domain-containing protein n=1 Tax=Clostridium TaxID=1485 RepID=UPI003D335BC1